MWNTIVTDVSDTLLAALRPLAAMAHEYPTTTLGIAVLFTLLVTMLSAEILDGRATASSRIDDAKPIRLKRRS